MQEFFFIIPEKSEQGDLNEEDNEDNLIKLATQVS